MKRPSLSLSPDPEMGIGGHQYSDTMCLSIIHYVVKPFSVKQTLSGFFSPNSPSCFQSVSYVFPCVGCVCLSWIFWSLCFSTLLAFPVFGCVFPCFWSCWSFVGFSDRCVFPHCWLHLQVVHLPGRWHFHQSPISALKHRGQFSTIHIIYAPYLQKIENIFTSAFKITVSLGAENRPTKYLAPWTNQFVLGR